LKENVRQMSDWTDHCSASTTCEQWTSNQCSSRHRLHSQDISDTFTNKGNSEAYLEVIARIDCGRLDRLPDELLFKKYTW